MSRFALFGRFKPEGITLLIFNRLIHQATEDSSIPILDFVECGIGRILCGNGQRQQRTQKGDVRFHGQPIRVITHDDGNWSVVAKDVCLALDYQWHHNLLSHVPDEWKGSNPIPTLGGTQEMLTLTEQGLYFFLGRSDKSKALPFQKWVYGDVIPTIRKTGSYAIPAASPKSTIREERELQALARDTMRTLKVFGITGNAAVLSTDNYCRTIAGRSLLEPLGATHLLADPRGMTYTPTELGKMCEPPLSAIKLNPALESAGLQKRDMGQWMPNDKAESLCEWLDTGKRHSNGTPVKQLKWFKAVLKQIAQGGMKEAA